MIDVLKLQQAYIDFYKQFRNYIWTYYAIEKMVALEMDIFQTCPNMDQLKSDITAIRPDIQKQFPDDEDFQQAYDDLAELINENSEPYYAINVVKEVIQDED